MKYLENNTIRLRALELKDLEFLYEHENDTRYWEISSVTTPFSTYVLEEYIKNAHKDIFELKELKLMIEKQDNSETIGMVDLFDFEPLHLRAGIGIMLSEKSRGEGYASMSLDLIINYSQKILRLNQLYCNIAEWNRDSIRLFCSKGFKKIGVKKSWINSPTGFKDVGFYQLIFEN